jgi:hypothetical protein
VVQPNTTTPNTTTPNTATFVDEFNRRDNTRTGQEDPAPERDGASTRLLVQSGIRALRVDGDLAASRELFDAAYRAAEREGNAAAMAQAALGMCGLWAHEHRTAAAAALAHARLQSALTRVDPRSTLALRLRIRLAGEIDYRNSGHAAILAVVEEARQVGDPVAWAEAASLAHHCLLGPDHRDLRHALAEDVITDGFRTGRRSDVLIGILWRTVDQLLDADPHAERTLSELRALLAERDHLAVGFAVQAIDVMLRIRSGHFAEAEALAAECAGRGQAAGDLDAAGYYGGHIVAIRWYQGRIGELMPMLRDLADSPTLRVVDNSLLGAFAVSAATVGNRREAAGALARLRGTDLKDLPRSGSWLTAMSAIVEAAHLLGDVELSTEAYQLLLPFARLPMVAGRAVVCFGSVQHCLGMAALTVGATERAVEHLRAAVHDNLALGHWPSATLSRWRLSQALGGRPGEETNAAREAAVAAEEAAGLGMTLPRSPSATQPAGTVRPTGAVASLAAAQTIAFRRLATPARAPLAGAASSVAAHPTATHSAALRPSAAPGSAAPGSAAQRAAARPLAAGARRSGESSPRRPPAGVDPTPVFDATAATAGPWASTGAAHADRAHPDPPLAGRQLVECRRWGLRWELVLNGESVVVEHTLGLGYLAILLANPGHEIPAVDLASGAELPGASASARPGQSILDKGSEREYRLRLAGLQAEIDEYESANDPERAAKVQAERDWLIAELVNAAGIGRPSKPGAGNTERARVAVGKAIRRAMARIAAAHPAIGEELRATIQTGLRCCYHPR